MEMIIKENHIIDDVEWVMGRLKEFLQENIRLEEIKNFILTQESTIFYFKQDLTKTNENDKNANTPNNTNKTFFILCINFTSFIYVL